MNELPKLNPYTKAMANCLAQFDPNEPPPALDKQTSHFLANMIQGRFLQYLVLRICEHYSILDIELEKKLTMVLMTILSDKFFNVFRQKVQDKPEIVYLIARKITASEIHDMPLKKADALYMWICKEYFAYQYFNMILKWINTNPEVEKIIFLSQVQSRIKDSSLIKALLYILQNDKDGITPVVFNRYLIKSKIDRIKSLIQTGDWKLEAVFVKSQYLKLINWRNYMSRL